MMGDFCLPILMLLGKVTDLKFLFLPTFFFIIFYSNWIKFPRSSLFDRLRMWICSDFENLFLGEITYVCCNVDRPWVNASIVVNFLDYLQKCWKMVSTASIRCSALWKTAARKASFARVKVKEAQGTWRNRNVNDGTRKCDDNWAAKS